MDSTETTTVETTETSTTTTAPATEASAPAAVPHARVSLALVASGELPSQKGVAGRPRGRGRAVVRAAEGTELNALAAREALAEALEIRLSDVSRYSYKAPEGACVFICARIPADEVREYVATPVEG